MKVTSSCSVRFVVEFPACARSVLKLLKTAWDETFVGLSTMVLGSEYRPAMLSVCRIYRKTHNVVSTRMTSGILKQSPMIIQESSEIIRDNAELSSLGRGLSNAVITTCVCLWRTRSFRVQVAIAYDTGVYHSARHSPNNNVDIASEMQSLQAVITSSPSGCSFE